MLGAAVLTMSCVLGAVPPLTSDQRVALATAFDGRDFQEEAFESLLDNTRQWTPGLADVPVRLEADLPALLQQPDEFRGELFRLTGKLEQHTLLPRPHEQVAEWFIRPAGGEAVIVYVDQRPAGPRDFRDGEQVTIAARFYKRMDFTARDGKAHSYASFVGALPAAGGQAAGPGGAPAPGAGTGVLPGAAAAALIVLMALFGVVLLVARRARGRRARLDAKLRAGSALRGVTEEESGRGEPLPEDPAAALAELKKRGRSVT